MKLLETNADTRAMTPAWRIESDLVPYRAVERLPGHHLLVLAPHPDDEVLGCGGLIAATLQQGAAVTVVVASDGAAAGDVGVREAESRAAALVLAAAAPGPALHFWRLPDRGLSEVPGLVARLQHLLATTQADTVVLPSPFEVHPDHRALCLAALHALGTTARPPGAWFYEVGQALMPDLLVDITPQLQRKREALRCFASQLALQAYDEQLLALNRFRAYTLGPEVSHAEAYQHVPLDRSDSGLSGVIGEIARRLSMRFVGAG